VRDAGQGGQLNTFPELSVAFWRWAIWKLFEAENAPRRGVIAFISNRKFITGWPYAGLRKMLRERFDRIEIIDLRGDVRRGERAGVEGDQGVFNIMVGTAITVAIADDSKAAGESADVFYQDCWTDGLFSRQAKLEWLEGRADAGTQSDPVIVARGILDDMRPMPFLNGELASLSECFTFYRSGVQTKRDEFVYSPDRGVLTRRLADFGQLNDIVAKTTFHSTAARSWAAARAQPVVDELLQRVAYRPFDVRWLYNHPSFIDRPRPELQEVWGHDNLCLYALPSGTGAGPALWCHGLLPDYHAFRGSYGGYAFPLHDRRPEVDASNVSPALVESLSVAYGEQIAPEDIFDAILCLLSASSYTRRFAEDLEDVFPHIPFPARHGTFLEAVRVGREIRAIEIFAREPAEFYRRPDFARVVTEPRGVLGPVDYEGGVITLCQDGSGRVTGLPQEVWNFSVSGYRLLPRWLEARIDLPADLALVRELRDICGRIAELIDLFDEADIVLESTLHESLTREALGVELGEQQINDG
jgi:predicted helicase